MASISRGRERQVLVLQGGGALGSYQAGVYQALNLGGFCPHWVAGISIGAINAAIIAGNPPGRRTPRLREFWERASASLQFPAIFASEELRPWYNEFSANWVATFGVPGFFAPRVPPAVFQPPGSREAVSFYDTGPLRETLEELVDFDLLNSDHIRLSVGAVNVKTGNFCYFDSAHQRIGPEHIMASGALPPGFPPVEIEGELYWDGGLVSNTPLQYVLDQETREDLLVFQVDLFNARGEPPQTLLDVAKREKDIRYSSRTRMNTDVTLNLHRAKALIRELIEEATPERRADPRVRELACFSQENCVTVAHLIFRPKSYDSHSRDYEFSRVAMLEHWECGVHDVERTLKHPSWLNRGRPQYGVAIFDLGHGGREMVTENPKTYAPEEERAPQARPEAAE